ncbi:MAG: hypothetical protein ACFFDT_33135, partial [Candidatus Hodarchaeota archaeon]
RDCCCINSFGTDQLFCPLFSEVSMLPSNSKYCRHKYCICQSSIMMNPGAILKTVLFYWINFRILTYQNSQRIVPSRSLYKNANYSQSDFAI